MAAVQDVSKFPLATTAPAAASNASTTGALQDRFLKLLVTQMKNQDPLNPLDNAQVTSQLAQINTVNGIEKLNTTLNAMSASFVAGQSLQSASLIGRTALADGNRLTLAAGAMSRGGVQLDRAADSVVVTVSGPAGNTVRQMELGPRAAGLTTFDWDGRNDAGATMMPGNYTFSVTAAGSGQKIPATPVAAGAVSGIVPDSNGIRLMIDGLGEMGMQQIRGIR